MTPKELAAIRERDAAVPTDGHGGFAGTQADADRADLLAHIDAIEKAVERQVRHAADNGHILDRDCQGVAPGERVPAVRAAALLAILRGNR